MSQNLTRWTRPSDYIGPNHDSYFLGLSRNRDSDVLTNSNFEVLLEMLGGETPFNLDTDTDETNLAVQVIRDSPSIDVRLCVDADGWIIRTGDSSYDPYHSEYCAASSVSLETDAVELVRDLMSDILDQIAEEESA